MFSLQTDVSDKAIGVVLQQRHSNEILQPLNLFSRTLTLTQARYSAYDSESCQIRQLLFILEFTTDFHHVSGAENIVADALSRSDTIVMQPVSICRKSQ
ncbi:hypothetical protein ALC62_10496 [Cyphomyrmex costatus]|uniref:Reverse transcriptase/retrotransposon-derived protein RNase H-like domain-containing protein n=1 Tax=Cyphomyrmex costatus TaxID=456900 RepID=A0A151IDQ7_9HYME|nr:hypothetical protein ALC62_10496 [Cyphomyrmex costatus]